MKYNTVLKDKKSLFKMAGIGLLVFSGAMFLSSLINPFYQRQERLNEATKYLDEFKKTEIYTVKIQEKLDEIENLFKNGEISRNEYNKEKIDALNNSYTENLFIKYGNSEEIEKYIEIMQNLDVKSENNTEKKVFYDTMAITTLTGLLALNTSQMIDDKESNLDENVDFKI